MNPFANLKIFIPYYNINLLCIQLEEMEVVSRRTKYFFLSFLKYDFRASLTVFFVALPLCLGISLASGAPLSSGIIAGIIGGLVVTIISGSQLSVSGPAAGLTAVCASAITDLGSVEILFLSVSVAGILQILLGVFRLGGFTRFIPSTVIKGMLAAIGIILMSKQIPILFGYDSADFWTKELVNVITFNHGFEHINEIYDHTSRGASVIALSSLAIIILREKYFSEKFTFLPNAIIVVLFGTLLAFIFKNFVPLFPMRPTQFVSIPDNLFANSHIPDFSALISNLLVLKFGLVICFVATIETLLSIEAIDKLDPYNRISPQNRELVAQGTGNFLSGIFGGLPITAVIVRSSANAEAGAKTKLSSFFHGIWMLLLVLTAGNFINQVPYCVLAVILVRTGYNLARPKMILSVYKLGREQFIPFLVTVIAILFTDLLIGVFIGIGYAAYFILKNTYKAGYTLHQEKEGASKLYLFRLAINVSFINKKKLKDELEKVSPGSIVSIDGSHSVYIDYDVLEVINEFKSKARYKNIELRMAGIPDVETLEAH